MSADGFQAWRQRGFEGWPMIATVHSVNPSPRANVVSQVILGISPGPGQPADLESFFHSIAQELNYLAAGVAGVTAAGYPEPQIVRTFVIQFTTDRPAGDELINAIVENSESPGRFRIFFSVRHKLRKYYPPYEPDDPPPSKRRRFDVMGSTTPRRSSASKAARVCNAEDARMAEKSKAAINSLAQEEGFKGYSIFFCPSPEDKARRPALKCLWGLGPSLVPYDTMHLFLCDVVLRLWKLLAGENAKLGDEQPWVIPQTVRDTIGREIKAGRKTVPLRQPCSLRNNAKYSGSKNAVDWLYFLPCTGEVVLADRIPEEIVKMFMLLFRAGRLVFKPVLITNAEVREAEKLIKRFCLAFYAHVYAGKEERLRVCRPTTVALLDVTDNLRSCGPARSFGKFPAERLLGALSRLIR